MVMPEFPVRIPTSEKQVDGVRENKPIYDTQRGFIPEGHEDKRPKNTRPALGPMVYTEED